MQVINLTDKYKKLFCMCLEDWSDEMNEAGDHKEIWIDKMKDRGLGVKLALDDNGEVGGMIQYVPIEQSFAEGKDLYFINCIWVHGYKKGRGNFQKKGMGKALLKAAEEDVKAKGADGLAAWGLAIPVFMRASWFKKHGYKKADNIGFQQLLWKPFNPSVEPPLWVRKKKEPGKTPGKVNVTVFMNGWCPGQNLAYERVKRAAVEFGDKVVVQKIDTLDRNNFMEWGISDALYIDGKQMRTGPPPSYKKIRAAIAKRVKKLKN
jgi:GNAT superfamily N-acetyltransferase